MFTIEHVGNSFDALRSYGDASVDLVLTDPPFDAETHANMRAIRNVDGEKIVGFSDTPRFAPMSPSDTEALGQDLARVSKRWAIAFCADRMVGTYAKATEFVKSCVWHKPNSMGQLTGDRPASAWEMLALLHHPKVKKTWNGRGSWGIWKCNGTRGKKGRHPNEKPLHLCLKLVALFSNRGGTVLDPFCGSAAIGEACLLLGRRYIGLDFDHEWVERAKLRLNAVEFGSISDEFALSLCTMNGQANGLPSEDLDGKPKRRSGQLLHDSATDSGAGQTPDNRV